MQIADVDVDVCYIATLCRLYNNPYDTMDPCETGPWRRFRQWLFAKPHPGHDFEGVGGRRAQALAKETAS